MVGQISKFHLIDGQQRITTLSLLLCALRDTATAAGCPELAQEITYTTLEHPYKKGTDRYRLFPKLRDRDQYIACLGGQSPAEGRLGAAVGSFSGRLTTADRAGAQEGPPPLFAPLPQHLACRYAPVEGGHPVHLL